MKKITVLYLVLLFASVLCACDRTEDPIYEKLSDNRFPVIFANTNFVTPSVPTGGFVKGTALKIEFNFVKTDPIKEIQFYEKLGTADSVLISKSDYAPAFSASKGCDTLIYNYIVPSAPASGTSVVFRGRVVNVNGLTKDRTFTYLIK
ncbi:hypothetical protein [Pedobacter metabolipauper]|uniref:Uncharacterized protein n=1 Tax=Pedobacter metabolipauper TaxID=425513 RepID=A0A4R6SWG0_9SPHI|nr:hypothetical protein [Pedobacter metabolipauper]TDQ09751.1 hypothetical protein ATK78_1909 [Pedobacter metabolipauper]